MIPMPPENIRRISVFGLGHRFLPGTRNSHFSRPVTPALFVTGHPNCEFRVPSFLLRIYQCSHPDMTSWTGRRCCRSVRLNDVSISAFSSIPASDVLSVNQNKKKSKKRTNQRFPFPVYSSISPYALHTLAL